MSRKNGGGVRATTGFGGGITGDGSREIFEGRDKRRGSEDGATLDRDPPPGEHNPEKQNT